MEQEYVIRCRGLPFSCTEQELKNFFGGPSSGVVSSCFAINATGKVTGEAYVKFATQHDNDTALQKDRQQIGKRYIEIFPSNVKEMEFIMRHTAKQQGAPRTMSRRNIMDYGDLIVRLRGLPFGVWEDDISAFFSGLDIAQDGILIVTENGGRQSGDGFVQFANVASFEEALKKNKESLGHRYIEVFASNFDELERFTECSDQTSNNNQGWGRSGQRAGGRGGRYNDDMDDMGMGYGGRYRGQGAMGGMPRYSPYGEGAGMMGGFRQLTPYPMSGGMIGGRGGIRPGLGAYGGSGGTGRVATMDGNGYPAGKAMVVNPAPASRQLKHYVHMRGITAKCGQEDIIQFFQPLRISSVQLTFDAMGRPSGEARVEFFTHSDAQEAVMRDRQPLSGQIIELFINSETTDDDPPAYLSMPKPAVQSFGNSMFPTSSGYDFSMNSF